MPDALPLIPEITDQDINGARDLLRLSSLDGPRRAFLAARHTLDVSACPGSGKTTLVVAKLAILTPKWPHRTKGVCVLSHTNVAREEVQRGLGSTVIGQRLLGYPHFIGTIHGFVNRFLALPWLRSNGYHSPTVDDDVTNAYRRGALAREEYWKVQQFLGHKHSRFDSLRISARDLSFGLLGKPFPARPGTSSFGLAAKAIKASAEAGYFCHDEMFVWARALLDDFPAVASWLRRRFPFVVIDEMQDTTGLQSAILHAVFPRASTEVTVQRLGDSNQAIFDSFDSETDRNDPFPDPDSARHLGIPNSYRFGPEIARLASPFAVKRVGTDGLCGIGPKGSGRESAKCPHAIFVFPDNSTKGVLDAYGRHVLTIFDDDVLAGGAVTAVGAVHQNAPTIEAGHEHFPGSVPHYWSGYSAEIARKEAHPGTIIQYVSAAQAAVRNGRDFAPGVERIGHGFIRLACCIGDARQLRGKSRAHRAVVGALATSPAVLAAYRQLIRKLLVDWVPLSEATWHSLRGDILEIACTLCEGPADQAKAYDFLAWRQDDLSLSVTSASRNDPGPNTYRVIAGDRYVDIRLGSIHSVKGQTHLATLLLSTFWYQHSSRQMLPWLLGTKVNKSGASGRDCSRLLHTYVAMTRPSHLVCIAALRSVFGDDLAFARHVQALRGRGWRLAEIVGGVAEWRA